MTVSARASRVLMSQRVTTVVLVTSTSHPRAARRVRAPSIRYLPHPAMPPVASAHARVASLVGSVTPVCRDSTVCR